MAPLGLSDAIRRITLHFDRSRPSRRRRPLPFGRWPSVSAATQVAWCTALDQPELRAARGVRGGSSIVMVC